MASYRELMQEVVNASDRERIALGKEALYNTISVLKNHGLKDDDGSKFIMSIIKVFVSADRRCSQAEYDLIRAITEIDFSEDEFYEISNGGADAEFVRAFDETIDCLEPEEKAHICLFGLTILASDEKMTKEEQDLFTRLSN